MITWTLVVFLATGTATNVNSTVVTGFRSEASCTAAAALAVDEAFQVLNKQVAKNVRFICLKQEQL